jgi:hypothetical protein
MTKKNSGPGIFGISPELAALGIAIVGIGGLAIVKSVAEGAPHDHQYKGEVIEERVIVGNVVNGYEAVDNGLKGKLKKGVNSLLRPGIDMHLYLLEGEVCFDQRKYFTTNHICEDFTLALQTVEDVADLGHTFNASKEDLGRVSNTFAAKGISYKADKDSPITKLHTVYKNSQIKFMPGKGHRN